MSCVPPTVTLCLGVIGTFLEAASRCLGVAGSRFPCWYISMGAFPLLKWALILGGETATLCSGAPCFAGTVRGERVFFAGLSLTYSSTLCDMKGFWFSSFGSLRTTRLFSRVDAAVGSFRLD